jgi:seryl-tRNA synthetase
VRIHGTGNDRLAGLVQDEVRRLTAIHRERKVHPITNHRGSGYRYEPDEVWSELLARREILDEGDGYIAYSGRLLALIRGLDEWFRDLSLAYGASEFHFPSTISMASAHRSGYLARFPHQAWFCAHFTPDLTMLTAYSQAESQAEAQAEQDGHDHPPLGDHLAQPTRMANPLLCFHVYQAWAERSLDAPLVAITTSGKCRRRETLRRDGLGRLSEFTMRELVYIGQGDLVAHGRDQILAATTAIARELDLGFTVEAAADPFFRIEDANLGMLQRMGGLKYELLAHLGSDHAPLAISSFNLHGETFIRRFRIGRGTPGLQTGCIGFGIERWALACLCRHGLDWKQWPAFLRSRCPLADVPTVSTEFAS